MKENKIAFSIDLDDWYHMSYITGTPTSMYPSVEACLKDYPDFDLISEPTMKLLEVLNKKNIKATFFINAHMIALYPKIMQAIKDEEHEVANHSYYHTIAIDKTTKDASISQDQWKQEVVRAKNEIESFFKTNVVGYRAPNIYITDWMLDFLIDEGFVYDSSLANNLFYDKTNLNITQIPRVPFYYSKEGTGEKIMELPWSNCKLFNYYLPGGGSFFFRLLGRLYFKFLLNQQLALGDTMFYMHPFELSDVPIPIRNKKSAIYWVGKGEKTLKAMSRLFDDFEGQWCTCKEVYERNKI